MNIGNDKIRVRITLPKTYPNEPAFFQILDKVQHRKIKPGYNTFDYDEQARKKRLTLIEVANLLAETFFAEPPVLLSAKPKVSKEPIQKPEEKKEGLKEALEKMPNYEKELGAVLGNMSIVDLKELSEMPDLQEDLFYSLQSVRTHEKTMERYLEELKNKAEKNITAHEEVNKIKENGLKTLEAYNKSYMEYSKLLVKYEKSQKNITFEGLIKFLQENLNKLRSEVDLIKKKFKNDKVVDEFTKNYVKAQTKYNMIAFYLNKISKSQYQYCPMN